MSSLLRASTGIFMAVPDFIAGYVAFDRPEPSSIADIEHMWAFLDIEPQHMDLFIKVNPMRDGHRLRVAAAMLCDSGCIGALTTSINYYLRWCDVSDTRWTKVGLCGRFYLRSLIIGIDRLVDLAVKNDAVCTWHFSGFTKKCSTSVRTYLAVAACAAIPS